MKHKNVEALKDVESIDWNGTSDISPQEYFVKRELGTFTNADNIIRNSIKYVRYLYYSGTFYLFDRYIKKLRNITYKGRR